MHRQPVIYVVGASIAGMILAERLHRSGQRVTLLAGGPPDPKRLRDGCSLRKSSIAAFAATFGDAQLWQRLGGGQGTFNGTGIERLTADGLRVAPRMLVNGPVPVALSTRHGVVAAQVPCIGSTLPVGFAPYLDRHLGFVTPFYDPATPSATHYVINTFITDNPSDAVKSEVERVMHVMAKAYGLTPIEVEATLGRAAIPIVQDFSPIPSSDPRVLNLYDAFSPGAPAVNVDGMRTQAWGAWTFANHLHQGQDKAFSAVRRHLREARFWNKSNTQLFFHASSFSRGLQLRLFKPLLPWLVRKWTDLATVDQRPVAT